jgi:peptidoglycan/LPS O-acetylase OafA/YrhL
MGKPSQLATLNGLRGVAAICVVMFHRSDWFGRGFPLPGAYLAVDFFFILSGFVVARAYSSKLRSGMAFRDFLGRRLQRLYPLVLLGVSLGAAVAVVKAHGHVGGLFALDLAATLVTLPTFWEPLSWKLDPPLWSLFFELAINIAFGLFALRLRGRALAAVVGIAGLAFLILSPRGGRPDATAYVGWGFLQVTFEFYLGVLVEHLHEKGLFQKLKIGFLPGSILLVMSFMGDITPYAEPFRIVSVCLLYPAIIIGGANREPVRFFRGVADWMGDMSYPIYVLHIPLFALLSASALIVHLPKEPVTPVGVALRLVAMGLMAFAVLKVYDEPVRRCLANAARGGARRAVARREAVT